jgi:general secretion pathway protein J
VKAQRGFTLIEMLVVMTILGLISLALLGSLRFGATAWQRSNGQGGSIEQIELAETVLRRALVSAYPYLSGTDPADTHIQFEGTSSRIVFLAPAPEALGGAGLARFTVAAEPAESGMRLTIAAVPELALPGSATPSAGVLIDGLEDAKFGYYGADDPGSDPSWHDSWSGRPSLPGMIRIRASFPRGDARHWAELMVAPQIAVDEGCMLDPLSHHCLGR